MMLVQLFCIRLRKIHQWRSCYDGIAAANFATAEVSVSAADLLLFCRLLLYISSIVLASVILAASHQRTYSRINLKVAASVIVSRKPVINSSENVQQVRKSCRSSALNITSRPSSMVVPGLCQSMHRPVYRRQLLADGRQMYLPPVERKLPT